VSRASLPVLEVVTASTRPGRVGRAFADWFIGVATEHGGFEVADVDLAAIALPFLDDGPTRPSASSATAASAPAPAPSSSSSRW
jgi:NAD(P)H-dependent FMN reductase